MAITVPSVDDEEEQGTLRTEYTNLFKSGATTSQLAPRTDLPASEPPPPPPPQDHAPLRDEYSAMFATQKQFDTAVKQKAAQSNADEKGKAHELSQRLGLPIEVVERNMDQATAKAKAMDAEAALANAPVTRQFFDNPDYAAMAMDSAKSLSMFEHVFTKGGDYIRSLTAGVPETFGASGSGLFEAYQALLRRYRSAGTALGLPAQAPEGYGSYIPTEVETLGVASAYTRELADAIRPPAERRDLGDEVAEGLGQVGAQIAIAMASGGAYGLTTLLTSFGQGVTQQSDKLKALGQQPTMGTDAALFLGGAITAVTERWGLGNLLERVPATFKTRLGRVIAGASSEAAQEFVENLLQNLTALAIYDPNQEVTEGVGEAATVGGLVGAIVSAIVPGKRAVQFQRQMDEGRKALAESKLGERSPTAQADFVAGVWEANGIKELYVPVKALDELAETKPDAAEFYRNLGVDEQLDNARLTNGDVKISLRAYAQHVLVTDDYQVLKDHTRQAIGEMTKAEADEYAKSGVKDEIERLGLKQEQMAPEAVSRDPDAKEAPPATPEPVEGTVRLYTAAPKDSKAAGPEWYTTDLEYAERMAAKKPKGQVFYIDAPADDPALTNNDLVRMTNQAAGTHVHTELAQERAAQRKVFNAKPEVAAANADVTLAEQQAGFGALFGTAAEAGMTPSQYTAYLEEVQRAQDTARDRMARKYLREQQRTTEADWIKEREVVRDQVEQSVRQEPIYMAMDAIGRERLNQAAVREILAEVYADPDAAMKALPKIDGRTIYAPKSEGGISPHVFAEQHGFIDAKTMLDQITKAIPLKQVIEERTDQVMEQKFGELANERRRIDAALKSLHNDRAADVLALELDALRQAKKEGRTNPKLIRAFAREQTGNMFLGDINTRQFLEAERREARAAGKAVRANDRATAAQAKFRQLVNFQYASEAIALEERLPKQRRDLKKFLRNRESHANIGADRIDQIRALLANVDLDSDRIRLADWNVLYERVKAIEAEGRRERQVIVAGRKAEFEAVRKGMLDAAEKVPDTKATERSRTTTDTHTFRDRVARTVDLAQAKFGKVEILLQRLDNGDPTGPWHQAIFQPVSKAQVAEFDLRKGTMGPLIDALEKLPDAKKRGRMKVRVPELELDMRVSELWMLALNVGNQSNFDKVIDGSVIEAQRTGRQPWTHESVMQALSNNLTEKEWAWVQSVWDAYAQLYPEVERIYRDEHGQSPVKVEPSVIRTPGGVALKGGYFPMLYDSTKASTVSKTSTLDLFEGDEVRAAVYSGMTRARTGYAAPVLLNIGALPRAIDQHIHFITHYDAVKDVRKILRDTGVSNAVKNKLGPNQYQEVNNWIEAVATGNTDRGAHTIEERFSEFFRQRLTAAIMGLSYTTAVAQVFGFTTTVAVLGQKQNGTFSTREGAKWLAVGLLKYAQNPSATVEASFKLSGELRHRFSNFERDVGEQMRGLDVGKGAISRGLAKQQRLTLSVIAAIQLYTVDMPTWIGAYNQAQSWGYDQERAVQHADAMLRTSQSSGHLKDLSQIQRDKGFMRLLTMFSSYTTLLYNLEAQTLSNAKKAPMSAIARFMWLVTIPAALDAVMRLELPGEDDNELWWPLRVASYAWSAVPIVGRPVDSMIRGYDPSLSPIESAGRQVVNAVKSTGKIFTDDDFDAKDFRHIAVALGTLTGVGGTTQLNRVLKAIEADDSADLYDYLIGYDEKRKRKGY